MPGFQSPVKLGRPRKELSFTVDVDELSSISQAIGSEERIVRNAVGEAFRRVFRRTSAGFRIKPSFPTSDSLKSQLESLKSISDEPLSFFFASAWPIHSDRYVTDTATTVKLSSSPYTRLGKAYKDAGAPGETDIIGISGVFADPNGYDAGGAQGGTNLFVSYAAATRIITISTPGPAGTVVFVNWTYNGALVHLRNFRARNRGGQVSGGAPLWDISLALEGV